MIAITLTDEQHPGHITGVGETLGNAITATEKSIIRKWDKCPFKVITLLGLLKQVDFVIDLDMPSCPVEFNCGPYRVYIATKK